MATVEATLQHLNLAAPPDSQQQQQQQQLEETPAALQNTACLAATFSWLDDERSLLVCAAVCQLWASVLQGEDVWRQVYLRHLPAPLPHERVSSYKQQFQRLRGLLDPPEPALTSLKGCALTFNEATGNLVSYVARQRLLSVQAADGSIRSEVAEVPPGAAGTAHRPLLASTGSSLVVLAAADGVLTLWDASDCSCQGVLGQHSSYVTSLCGSGPLVASSCASDLKLWDVASRSCLYTVLIGLQLPTPSTFLPGALEPQVVVCHQQQLLALANCAAPAPSSIVKVYSTHPAPLASKPQHTPAAAAAAAARAGAGTTAAADPAAAAAAAAVSVVGDSSRPGCVGALLLRELPVNAASDVKLVGGLLVAASSFHARGVSANNSPFKSERAYTVVISIWETKTWQLTRLMSPRLWTDTPQYSMTGLPILHVTQGIVYCATLRPGSNNAFPSCCVYAMQLPAAVLAAGAAASSSSGSSGGGGEDGGSGSSAAAAGSSGGSSGSSRAAAPGSSNIGTGAMAQGRIQVATVGGIGPVGYKHEDTVMLSISDRDRQAWVGREPIVADTGGRLTVLLTTPTELVMATEGGQVLSSALLPAVEQQQQPEEQVAAAAGSEQQQGEPVAPVVHVLQAHATGSRFISLDL